ncbi:MAG: GxxExxY protein [Bacteroidetes bacterium]|nr:GxxExxY protein [Bacteroidota bacterium]
MTQNYINELYYRIVGCAIEVHKELGPGLLESIYQKCLLKELELKGFEVDEQIIIPVSYKGDSLDCDLRLDILVEDLVIVELKSVETMLPIYKAQLLTYMKLLKKPKGLLINFNTENITKDLVPLVNEYFSILPKQNL